MHSNGGAADPPSSSSSLTTEAEEADENNHQVFRNTVIAFKPRLLYSTIVSVYMHRMIHLTLLSASLSHILFYIAVCMEYIDMR